MATKYDGLIYRSEKEASNRITDMTFGEFEKAGGIRGFLTYRDLGFTEAEEENIPILSEQEIIEIANNGKEIKWYLQALVPHLKNRKRKDPEFVEEEYIKGWIIGCCGKREKGDTVEEVALWEDIDEKINKRFEQGYYKFNNLKNEG